MLCALVALGELRDARDLLERVRGAFGPDFNRELDARIDADPDLALLR